MDLTKSAYRDQSRPEVVELKFPDISSQGIPLTKSSSFSARGAWQRLAKEKGQELEIPFEVRPTREGLSAAFLCEADATRLLGAMAPEWRERLIEGLRDPIYYTQLASKYWREGAEADGGAALSYEDLLQSYQKSIRELAEQYDLDPAELVDYHGRPALDGFE